MLTHASSAGLRIHYQALHFARRSTQPLKAMMERFAKTGLVATLAAVVSLAGADSRPTQTGRQDDRPQSESKSTASPPQPPPLRPRGDRKCSCGRWRCISITARAFRPSPDAYETLASELCRWPTEICLPDGASRKCRSGGCFRSSFHKPLPINQGRVFQQHIPQDAPCTLQSSEKDLCG